MITILPTCEGFIKNLSKGRGGANEGIGNAERFQKGAAAPYLPSPPLSLNESPPT